MVGIIIQLAIIIPFLLLAIVFSMGKGGFLIAGYNTMSQSEKEKYDEIAICKFMGKIMYGICFSMLLWALSEILNIQSLFIIGLVLFFAFLIFMLVFMNTGNRFRK